MGSTWPAVRRLGEGEGAMILVGSWIANEVGKSAAPSREPGFSIPGGFRDGPTAWKPE